MAKRLTKSGRIILYSKEDREIIAHFEKFSQAYVDKITTREAAMEELIRAGIYGRDGKLTKQYRSIA